MPVVADAVSLLGAWQPQTSRSLQALGAQEAALPPDLVQATGGGGRIQLRAERWQLGRPACGECRLVRIEGATSEIVNVLVFPSNPRTTPTFVAEGLVFGGRLRLAFVDVQTPGMDAAPAALVGRRTAALAGRLDGQRPGAPELPAWAVDHSPGHYFAARDDDGASAAVLETAYREYLDLWVELAGAAAAPDDADAAALTAFKRSHLAHWPGTDYLAKLFGADWSRRFIHEFLYR